MPVVGSNTLQTVLTEQDTNNSIVTTSETILLVEQNTTNMIVLAEYGSPVIGVSSSTFLGLTDTPNSYTGQANKLVSVNANETSLVFTTIDTGGNVDSVFGRTGAITAESGDYASFYAPIVHTHTVSNITDLTTYYYDKTSTNSLLNNKTNLVTGTVGNFAELDGLGQLQDSQSNYSSFATWQQGTLADSALQPGNNISLLTNDSGYITAADIPSGSVSSVFGRTGAVTAELSDYSLFYTQPGENVSIFNNDAGYITAADIPPDAGVASFNGRSGVVVPVEADYAAYFATNEQGALADTALQTGDNVSELINDANYITLAQVPAADPTDLTTGYNSDYIFVYSSTGADTTITAATSVQAGVMANTDKITLDAAIQPGDNVSELTNDANYITLAQVPADAVSSVHGRTGAVTAESGDYSSFYATTAQGALADSALQPNDNNSLLVNDSGYITLAQVPADAVSSVFGRTGAVVATAGDYDAFYYTEAETNSQIAASMTTHVNAANPHPQYLTAEDLPETRPAWYTKVVNGIDPAFYVSANVKPTTAETSVSATGDNTGVPVLIGQWMPPAAYAQAFDFYETALTFQYDIDCTTNDAEIYVEVWLRRAAGGEILLATGNRIPLTSDRQTYSGSLIIPGPVSIAVGDITFSRMYLNKTGGTDPTATLYMEGNNLTRMIITQPIPSYPAPHAFTHKVGGTDQIDHSQIAGAYGYLTHAEIDAELGSLLNNFANYLPLAGGIMQDDIIMERAANLMFYQDDNVTLAGGLGVTDFYSVDSNSELVFTSDNFIDGMDSIPLRIKSGLLNIDTPAVVLGVPGAATGSRLVATGIDQDGSAMLGWEEPPVPTYTVSTTNNVDVVIGTGTAPTAWVALAPSMTVTQDIPAGDAELYYSIYLQNLTARSGSVDIGYQINGAAPVAWQTIQVANQVTSVFSGVAPNSGARTAGDVLVPMGRIGTSNNAAYLVTALNSTRPCTFKLTVEGEGGGSGATTLDELLDVAITTPVSNQTLVYNGALWVNQAPNADIIQSVFGRTGFVTAESGDYDAFYYTESEVDSQLATKLTAIVEDTSPKLGGDLDTNLHNITFADTADVATLFTIKDTTHQRDYVSFGTATAAETGFTTDIWGTLFREAVYKGNSSVGGIGSISSELISVGEADSRYIKINGNTYALDMNNNPIADTSSYGFYNSAAGMYPSSLVTPADQYGILFLADKLEFANSSGVITARYPSSALAGTAGQVLTSDGLGNITFQTPASGGGGAVDSVFGRTGFVTAESTDYSSFYATTAQGTLADTALQSGANISELTNDSGYITAAQVPADAVSSVFGRTGIVSAQSGDYSSFYATTAQGALADTASQPGSTTIDCGTF